MNVKKAGIVFWLFMVIYCPIFCRINTLYIIGIVSWFYILCSYQKTLTSMKNRYAKTLYIFLWVIFLYGIINSLINFRIAKPIFSPVFYWGGIVFPALFLISNKCHDNNIDTEKRFVELLLIVGNIQGTIALFLYLFPEIRYKYLSFLDANKLVGEGLLEQVAGYRYYGISSSIITYMPLAQIVLALMAIWLFTDTQKKRYILYFPLIAFSAFINARTPIVIFVIGIIMLVLFRGNKRKRLLHSFGMVVTVLFFVLLFSIFLEKADTAYTRWFLNGINSVLETIQGKNSYSSRTGLVFVAPENFFIWLVGIGSTIIGSNPYGQATDMGYANYIWMGGILYVIILILFYFLIAKEMIRMGVDIFIIEILYMAILVFSYKMPVLYDNEFMRLFYAIYIWNIVNKYRNNRVDIFRRME